MVNGPNSVFGDLLYLNCVGWSSRAHTLAICDRYHCSVCTTPHRRRPSRADVRIDSRNVKRDENKTEQCDFEERKHFSSEKWREKRSKGKIVRTETEETIIRNFWWFFGVWRTQNTHTEQKMKCIERKTRFLNVRETVSHSNFGIYLFAMCRSFCHNGTAWHMRAAECR